MFGIRVLLIGVLLFLLVYFLRYRRSTKVQAGRKIALALFVVVSSVAVVFPEGVTTVANRLGVGRGADLLLYLLVPAVVYSAMELRLKIADLEDRLAVIAREVALGGEVLGSEADG